MSCDQNTTQSQAQCCANQKAQDIEIGRRLMKNFVESTRRAGEKQEEVIDTNNELAGRSRRVVDELTMASGLLERVKEARAKWAKACIDTSAYTTLCEAMEQGVISREDGYKVLLCELQLAVTHYREQSLEAAAELGAARATMKDMTRCIAGALEEHTQMDRVIELKQREIAALSSKVSLLVSLREQDGRDLSALVHQHRALEDRAKSVVRKLKRGGVNISRLNEDLTFQRGATKRKQK